MEARQYTYTEDIQKEAIETYYRKRNRQKKANRKYFIKQKLFGLLMVLFGVLVPIVCDGDATVSLLIIPVGLAVLTSKEDILVL